jgi:uncharacterized membrane protein YbaN (DUF454 family)
MLAKTGYFIIGIISLLVGIIGAFVPVLPTTVFILIAAWAFARSSRRLHNALLNHPRTGPAITAWRSNQCIPLKAKKAAVISIIISFTIVWLTTNLLVNLLVLVILSAVVYFILTRPSQPADKPPATD